VHLPGIKFERKIEFLRGQTWKKQKPLPAKPTRRKIPAPFRAFHHPRRPPLLPLPLGSPVLAEDSNTPHRRRRRLSERASVAALALRWVSTALLVRLFSPECEPQNN